MLLLFLLCVIVCALSFNPLHALPCLQMLNLIQVGDYGTDDDDSEDELEHPSPLPSPELSPRTQGAAATGEGFGRSLQMSSVDIMDKEIKGEVSLDHLRGGSELAPKTVLTPAPARHGPTAEDLRALQAFQEETKLTTSHSVFAFLISYDQLCREIGKASVFRGFVEGPIQFKCSYKFDPFTEVYDTSRKARSPAWCDRVLYSAAAHTSLDQYRCIHGKFHSDHRAVVAIFTVQL